MSAEMSAFSFTALNGMLIPAVAFLGPSSLIISFLSIAWNENKFWILIRFLVNNLLRWNLYLLMHFSTGSKISCKISKFETVSLKKVFSSLAISWSFFTNSIFSTSFMFGSRFSLFEREGLTGFQKSLLLFYKRYKLLKEFSLSFL